LDYKKIISLCVSCDKKIGSIERNLFESIPTIKRLACQTKKILLCKMLINIGFGDSVDSNRDQSIFRMAIACLKVEWS
jgi:hypothetical protein